MRHKHADLIHAWAEGAEIQKSMTNGAWEDVAFPMFDGDREYRVKPRAVKKWQWAYKLPLDNYWHISHHLQDDEVTRSLVGIDSHKLEFTKIEEDF